MNEEIEAKSLETKEAMVNCPNGCGPLTIIEKPLSIGLMLSEEVERFLPPLDLENFPTLRAVCPKCGLVAIDPPAKTDIPYEPPYQWAVKEPEESEEEI